jgi:hypothetical protein
MKTKISFLIMFFAGYYSYAQQPSHSTPIDSIQYVISSDLLIGKTDPSNFNYGDTITVQGVVTFDPQFYGQSASRRATWLQDTSSKPWSGINVFIDPAGIIPSTTLKQLNDDVKFNENFKPGYVVKCTGILKDYWMNTQMNLLPLESEIVEVPSNIDTLHPLLPISLTIDVFHKNDGSGGQLQMFQTGEQYEGMYVKFENVTVVDVSNSGNGRFYWFFQDENGNKMQIRDNSCFFRNDNNQDAKLHGYTFTPPPIGTRLDYIKGIIVQSVAADKTKTYQLSPLVPSDVKVRAAAPYITTTWKNPAVPKSTQGVTVTAKIIDNDGIISKATLYYAVGLNNTIFIPLNMTSAGGNDFKATIPPAANGEYVKYWIKAVDDSGLVTKYPDSLATGSLYKVMDNGINSISDIQNTPLISGKSIWDKDTLNNISIPCIVTATLGQLGLVVVQDGTNPFSGIYLKATMGDGLDALKIGDSILIKSAIVQELYNVTHLLNTGNGNFEFKAHNRNVQAIKNIHPDSINKQVFAYSEAYEGMLLEFNNIYVVNNNPDLPTNGFFGEWSVNYDTNLTSGLRCDDQATAIDEKFGSDTLKLHQKLDFLKGILYYSHKDYKLLPRDKNDIAGYHTDTGSTSVTELPNNKTQYMIYPNPFQDHISVVSVGKEKIAAMWCIDQSGRTELLFSNSKNNNSINVINTNSLSPGIYFIELLTNNGKHYSTKLVKAGK